LLPLNRGPYWMDTRHQALVAFLIESRHQAGFTQANVVGRLDRYQSFVALVEGSHRRVDFAEVIGFDRRKRLDGIAR
jgi:hypothetical protein